MFLCREGNSRRDKPEAPVGPGAATLEPVNHNIKPLKPINQPIRARCRYSAFFRSSVDSPRNQSSCPVEASRLQLTHSAERAARAQATITPTAINTTEQREDNIWLQESLSVGQQLKPEQCHERSGSQRQSEPLVFKGADHVASAVAPINRAFSQKPTSADPLSPTRCHHQDPSPSGAHPAGRGSMSAAH